MNELIALATDWYALPLGALIFTITFGLVPGLLLRLIVLIYPKSDPRRTEFVAPLHHMGRLERLEYVGDAVSAALTEGVANRIKHLRTRQATHRVESPEPNVEDLEGGYAEKAARSAC